MDFQQQKENSEKNLNTIITTAWEDEAFKQELLADPVSAIEKLSGQPLDLKGKNIVVTDQTDPSTMHINIPPNPSDMELSEEQLEAVAGGTTVIIAFTLICIEW